MTHPQVQQAPQGRTLLRPDQSGWIELITDGEQIWVKVGEGRVEPQEL